MIKVEPGDRYGDLTVIKEEKQNGVYRMFCCLCDCGIETTVKLSSLRSGVTKSCGCRKAAAHHASHYKHGLGRHPHRSGRYVKHD
jgi:hypothetical protein